ncbi:hypothetical protein L1987_01913 [Smallanthus sonchifolius]|uniref:Uncharacterized protein n=1 Tax=Smallanthus sonchifolius TaxID=185202 RepID=A0ACB9K6D5_9ASTR|nr:hypothetical protein L1987_01913 [Smallanthus sonchifolius]
MAPTTLRKAIGAVKDQTSIGIAKVASNMAPELEVVIVKAGTQIVKLTNLRNRDGTPRHGAGSGHVISAGLLHSARNSSLWLLVEDDSVSAKSVGTSFAGPVLRMGRTVHGGWLTLALTTRALRIGVGMSKGCVNRLPEVLQISDGSGVRILTLNPYQTVDLLMAPTPAPEQVQVEA